MRKLLTAALALALFAVSASPALACGPRSAVPRHVGYTVCGIQSCTRNGIHFHDGIAYRAHSYGDGHHYHGYCDAEDCLIAGYHAHDGEYHFGHTVNDGHTYHDYCGVAGCTLSGYHAHDGEYHFGHTVNDGHGNHHSGWGHH